MATREMALSRIEPKQNLQKIDSLNSECNKKEESPILQFRQNEQNGIDTSVQEFSAEKEESSKKSFWTKVAVCSAFALTCGIAGFAIFKNIRLTKELTNVTSQLAKTTAELNTTKATLNEATGLINQIYQITNTTVKPSIGDVFSNFMRSATSGLKMTNEVGAECSRLCDTVAHIKNVLA